MVKSNKKAVRKKSKKQIPSMVQFRNTIEVKGQLLSSIVIESRQEARY